MKSPHFSMLPLVFAALFSLSWATSPHDDFLRCLSLRSNDSSSISKVIYTPINSSYSSVLESTIRNLRFSTRDTPKPLVIVTPLSTSHIQATIYCSRRHGLQIRTRSGGHDFEGLSYVSKVPFIVIDLVNFRSVDVDVENKVAWVQSGAVLGELYYRIAERSRTLAFPAGTCHTVGTGGYFTGGGYGLLFRKYGLAVDNIVDAQLIDVNGRILDRKSMGEDLFWAIRGGGGGSFGIVLAWKLNLVSVPATVTAFTVTKTLEQNAIKLIHRWQYIAHELPDGIYSAVSLNTVNSSQDGKKTILASFSSLFLGGTDELVSLMQERFPELGLVKEDCIEMSWIESILYFGQIQNESLEILLDRTFRSPLTSPSYKAKSDYVKEPIPEIGLRGLWSRLSEAEVEYAIVGFFAYGGTMDEIPETATPFPHRAGNLYKILYSVGWQEEDNINSERYISWIRTLYSYMSSFVSKSPREAYINYRDLDIGTNKKGNYTSYAQASVWGRKYFKNNFDRLVRVKTMIDPDNFFRHEQSIPPLISSRK
ncbi:berberine bridge enzyme-like 18 [Durio zibethinus]|uniref:Berberine bridge enzyme-like 18 n=1 Tax=Durio zibethinus TaxID=66656 RepID=A0A6P6AJJ2_DURZI|nr:berberine bridge enzyme-like 18 [Durio zibethinus]